MDGERVGGYLLHASAGRRRGDANSSSRPQLQQQLFAGGEKGHSNTGCNRPGDEALASSAPASPALVMRPQLAAELALHS